MRRRGHHVRIATMDPRDAPRSWLEDPAAPMVAVPGGRLAGLSRQGRSNVRELIRSADVVHLHGVWERSTNQIAREAIAAGVPYIQSLRGMLDDRALSFHPIRKRFFLATVARRTLREARFVHCTASGEALQARRWLTADPVVIPNLLDLRSLLTLNRRESATPRALYLGRVHPTKGLSILIEAVGLLASRGLRVEVDVAGGGEPVHLQSMLSLATRLGLRDQFRFLGHVDDAARSRLLGEAWLLASPTEKENFGNALFEALAAGVPVVVTEGLDADSELRASGGARLVPRHAHAFADAIESLVRDANLRTESGEAARRWSELNMDPDRLAIRFDQTYQAATGR
jgi:glycosyltransferase involved in cell wall biosynthesis